VKSRQPSVTPKQLNCADPPLFVDRNIDSDEMCGILTKAGMLLERHKHHFDKEEVDDVWITTVGNKNWAILTADKNIENNHLHSVIRSKSKLVILIGKRSGAIQWASSVVVSMERIFRYLQENDGPLILRVAKSGEITKVRKSEEILSRFRRSETAKVVREKRHGRAKGAQ
jgi:hypothetical protein